MWDDAERPKIIDYRNKEENQMNETERRQNVYPQNRQWFNVGFGFHTV